MSFERSAALSKRPNELLIVLSKRGEVAWPTFRHYVAELAARPGIAELTERIPHYTAVILNVLQGLGYANSDFSGVGTVRVAPRVLARLPIAGRPQAVLVGHRLADTEQELHKACAERRGAVLHAADDDVYLPLVPRRLLVEADDEDLAVIAKAVEALYSPEPAAWRVLQFAGTVAEYTASLHGLPQRDLNWERRDFDPEVVDFREPADDAAPHDRLVEFRDPQTGRNRYYFRRDGCIAEVDRDWGRYAALASVSRSVLLYTTGGEVFVPLGALLPAPYATALALCSGYAPYQARRKRPAGEQGSVRYLVYRGVPRFLAELAATKLGQGLETISALEEITSCC